MELRKDFFGGGATAANEYEGGYLEGGKGLSIADVERRAQDMASNTLKILLCCTSGLTTSYFAYLMPGRTTLLNQTHHCVDVDAINYLELDAIQNQYDCILLAPQIDYHY